MYKIGLSTCSGKELNEGLFFEYKIADIDCMEISPYEHRYDDINYNELKLLSEKYGIELWSFHLPFSPFSEIDISSLSAQTRSHTIERLSELIKKAADIGINKFIIHSSIEPIREKREERMKNAKESLSLLCETASRAGGVIAVENLPRTCLGKNSDEIIDLISADKRLKICFDTNHLLSEPISDFIGKLSQKIITTHISDYDFLNERHWLPGEGKIDWAALYNQLSLTDYNGVWLYEIGFDSNRNIERKTPLCCKDFYNNAMEIFSKKVPTPHDKVPENLQGWE